MPEYRMGGALNAARWPFVAALQGRTVINPIYDVANKVRASFSGTEESADNTVPQIMYCENAMPTAEGIASVGYQELVPASANTDFDSCIILRDANEVSYVYSPGGGKNYILNNATLVWASTNPIVPPAGTQVSRAHVNGRMFICYANFGVYEYDSGLGTIVPVALTGLVAADVISITNSSNYLIAVTTTAVYWSSLTNPTDFVPDLTTGAGTAIPQDVRGLLVSVQAASGGYIIYTTRNAVAAAFTNNTRAPFVFKEIAGAGGIYKNEQVTQDAISGVQYAWTTNGLQRITLQQAEFISAEFNDFIAGRLQMTWDSATKTLNLVAASGTEFVTKVCLIANRFLCVSYTDSTATVPVFKYCLIYDLALKRWGQMKIDHVDCFAFQVPTNGNALTFTDLAAATFTSLGGKTFNQLIGSTSASGNPSSKRMIGFLTASGAIELALMDYQKDFTNQGVVVFGRHQLTRQRLMTHQLTEVEGAYGVEVSGVDSFQAYVINSIDGYNFQATQPLVKIRGQSKSLLYGLRVTGINQCIVFTGTFALSSYIVAASTDGTD
jgi:hypothetical protein